MKRIVIAVSVLVFCVVTRSLEAGKHSQTQGKKIVYRQPNSSYTQQELALRALVHKKQALTTLERELIILLKKFATIPQCPHSDDGRSPVILPRTLVTTMSALALTAAGIYFLTAIPTVGATAPRVPGIGTYLKEHNSLIHYGGSIHCSPPLSSVPPVPVRPSACPDQANSPLLVSIPTRLQAIPAPLPESTATSDGDNQAGVSSVSSDERCYPDHSSLPFTMDSYKRALEATEEATVNEQQDLVVISPDNKELIVNKDGLVLMNTIMTEERLRTRYNRMENGKPYRLPRTTWLTASYELPAFIAKQVQKIFASHGPRDLQMDKYLTEVELEWLTQRVLQYLGSHPSYIEQDLWLVQMFIDPSLIQRPCINPSVIKKRCSLPDWSLITAASTHEDEKRMYDLRAYTHPINGTQYPCTFLGYSYDWGSQFGRGTTEFVAQYESKVIPVRVI